jgi:hypothetical protein
MTVICMCVILHLERHAFVIISVQYNFLYDFLTHLQSLKNNGGWLRATRIVWQINLFHAGFLM